MFASASVISFSIVVPSSFPLPSIIGKKTGRPKGSKNKEGHNAGGSRSRSEKNSKPVLADFFAAKTPKAAAPPRKDLPPPPRHDTTDPNKELLQEERERMCMSQDKLRQVVMHPSSKYHGSVVTEDDSDCLRFRLT